MGDLKQMVTFYRYVLGVEIDWNGKGTEPGWTKSLVLFGRLKDPLFFFY